MRSTHSRTIWRTAVALSAFASLAGPSRPALAELTFEVVKGFARADSVPGGLVEGSDGALYGTTIEGGVSSLGTLFRFDEVGDFTRLHAFTGAQDGAYPGALVRGGDGAVYGTTYGTVFRVDSTGNFTTLHSFGGNDGTIPSALVAGTDGALYGTMRRGGPSAGGDGTIFRVDSAGNFTTLHSFNGSDGRSPDATLVVGSDAALYGTTSLGGSLGAGTVFRIDAVGNFTLLYSFNESTDGRSTIAPLVLGNDGALYGVNEYGGPLGVGAIFRIDSAGAFTTLYSFTLITIPGPGYTRYYFDGAHPISLVVGRDGALYGTTAGGGPSGAGTIFRIDTAGTFTSLVSFGGPYYAYPGALIAGSDGALYGTTRGGYGAGLGTVFRIDIPGTFTLMHAFGGTGANVPPDYVGTDGAFPSGALVQKSDGALYGTTSLGGATGLGTIFKIDAAGNFTSLHSLSGAADGQLPLAALVRGRNGALYGTTQHGGPLDMGTVFQIDNAGTFTSLHSFNGADGAYPSAPLVLGSDGALYGTTPSGGASGHGAIFKIDSLGSFTSLYSFTDGFGEPAALAPGADGTIYGGAGREVFKIDSAGTFTPLHSLEPGPGFGCTEVLAVFVSRLVVGSDGALYGIAIKGIDFSYVGCHSISAFFRIDPSGTFTSLREPFPSTSGPLVLGSDGAFYGTTPGPGSIFRVDSAGTFTSLHSFSGTDGAYPSAPLVLGSDGTVFGTTSSGGSSDAGTVFRIDSARTFASLHSFDYTDGYYPSAPLSLGNDGTVFGTTSSGGSSDAGTVFRIDSAGTFTSLHSFDYTDGAHPSAPPVLGSDCALYGTTAEGGPNGGGIVYRLFEAGHLCQRLHFEPLPDRSFGDPPFTISATVSSGLPVSLRASGSCSITGDQVMLTGAGLCTLMASQVGDADYEPAPEVSQAFNVLFDFRGFLPPVEGPPAVNRVNAGRVVPIAFELAGDPGPGVLEAALVRRVDCDTLAPEGDFEPAASPGAAAPRSAASKGRYMYPWKTQKSWAGSCRELALPLVDGSVHRAYFSFKSRPLSGARRGKR